MYTLEEKLKWLNEKAGEIEQGLRLYGLDVYDEEELQLIESLINDYQCFIKTAYTGQGQLFPHDVSDEQIAGKEARGASQ